MLGKPKPSVKQERVQLPLVRRYRECGRDIMRTNEKIKILQARVQQLYNIPLKQFTHEDAAELRALDKKADEMGYERELDGTTVGPIHILYVPKGN